MTALEVTFPAGVRVDVSYKGHIIPTDQPLSAGGKNTAPSPFDLFLASIAGCMGFYALRFCQERNISTEELALTVEPVSSEDGKRIRRLDANLVLPAGFPEKYREAIARAIDHCTVKRHIAEPPEFALHLHSAEELVAQ